LSAYHQGHAAEPPTLDLSAGTVFQQSVWRALLDVPSGQTISYGTLAQRLGNPSGVRAVAAAVGRNPLSIIVPCHRIVGADGSLTGYAGGLDRKRALLLHEDSACAAKQHSVFNAHETRALFA
jgi:methylated-DNA-[protein]-cysteine S-methyltransferase